MFTMNLSLYVGLYYVEDLKSLTDITWALLSGLFQVGEARPTMLDPIGTLHLLLLTAAWHVWDTRRLSVSTKQNAESNLKQADLVAM